MFACTIRLTLTYTCHRRVSNFYRRFIIFPAHTRILTYLICSFFVCFKGLPANNNGNVGAVIILPAPFKAVFVRINPTAWENSIALKVEFYGCKINEPLIPGNEESIKSFIASRKPFIFHFNYNNNNNNNLILLV